MKPIEQSHRLLTGGGVETHLVFTQGAELREFCGFDVFRQENQLEALERSFLAPIADAALESGFDLLLDALTWRAHEDFVRALGHAVSDVERINQLGVSWMRGFVQRWAQNTQGADRISVFVNGDIGPRGDGYRWAEDVGVDEAFDYHRRQVEALAGAGVDLINPLTMTNVNETVAIAKAASEVGLPCIVSATLETDGTTLEGVPLGEFIERVDEATSGSPLFYMVNCAHPTHLAPTLDRARDAGEAWLGRFRGFRANSSEKSHAELDESTDLDRGHPAKLASEVARLVLEYDLELVGGCCGTDAEHIARIARAASRSRTTEPMSLRPYVGASDRP